MFCCEIRKQISNLIPIRFSPRSNSRNNFSRFLCYVQSSANSSLSEFRENESGCISPPFPAIGRPRCAGQPFDEMPQRRYRQHECNGSLNLAGILRDVEMFGAKSVNALALKRGNLSDLHTVTCLLTAYSKNWELQSALALFNEFLDRDVVLWNAMMSACIENKFIEAAVSLFNQLISEGNGFDHTTLLIAISAFSYTKTLHRGQAIHGLSLKSGFLAEKNLSNALINMYAKCADLSSADCLFISAEFKDLDSWNSMITGYLYNGDPEKSLYYFKSMASHENEADSIGISSAIAACALLQASEIGIAIHGYGIKLGYVEENFISVANSLISFYSQIRDIESALRVFEGIAFKNAISWNSMIKGSFINDDPMLAFSLLHNMQFLSSFRPDLATVLITLPFCAELSLLKEGKAFHGFVVRMQMAHILSVQNSLINLYSKCCFLKEAEYLFRAALKKDSISWNTMVFGYAQSGNSSEAKRLFKEMLDSDSSSCSLPTLLAVTPSCDSPGSYEFGKSIHGWSVKAGFSNCLFGLNSLIYMYITCGVPSDAFKLLDSIDVSPDVTSWNAVICGCALEGHSMEALKAFNSMRRQSRRHFDCINVVSALSACGDLGFGMSIHGLCFKSGTVSDIRVQNSLVTMYGRAGDPESAMSAFHDSWNVVEEDHRHHHHHCNLCSWNCAMSALSRNRDAKKALQLFSSLEFSPDEVTLCTVLSACTQLGAVGFGKQIHGRVFRSRLRRNPAISSALIDMYSSCGRLEAAERVFDGGSPEKNSVSEWNSLIHAYGFHSRGEAAVDAFRRMTASGIRPTRGTFARLITACGHAGLVDHGMRHYDMMAGEYGLRPSTEHHVAVVGMLGRCGRLREARDFVEAVGGGRGGSLWGALLSCCGSFGDVEMGREVGEILMGLEPENASYYVTLCNAYVGAGRWEEAVEIRNLIREKRLKKKHVGYSTVDVDCTY